MWRISVLDAEKNTGKTNMYSVMDIQHVLQECRMDSVLTSLGIKSKSSKDLFVEQGKRWTTNPGILRARSEAWRILKSSPDTWKELLPKLLENEETIRSLDPATASESQTEDWSQILFTDQLASLNFIPFLLMYVALSKIILAPLLAWTMPFMSILLPFIALKYVYRLPITWSMYWDQMSPMIFGRRGQQMDISTLLQWGSMLVSYGHSMYLPYTSALHCYKIDQLMIKGSRAVVESIVSLRKIADIWTSLGIRKPWAFPDPSTYGDERQVLAWLIEDKTLLPQIYRAIGQVEISVAFCNCDSLVPVEWSNSSTPLCKMVDAIDPLLEKEKRVPFTLSMSNTQHHAICTGPNRGGKSTFLRSTLTNLALAHLWGLAFASKCILTPVEWVISSLRLEDRPGQASLFEREVSVAGDIVQRIREGKTRGWIVIDELFHTTNPPDAATASQLFLQQLWLSNLTSSIVSTHLFSHAEEAPPNVQRLCVDSVANDSTDKIEYKYKVVSGVNRMSSVRELLLESKVVL
jgi:hypothetical protein